LISPGHRLPISGFIERSMQPHRRCAAPKMTQDEGKENRGGHFLP
jgi:hypothetical protein